MLYGFVLVVHVVVCLLLVFVVLLQAGRGGGFSDMLGGGQPSSLFGTQTNAFMVKATEVSAVLFIITSLSLGMLSTQKGKSLVEKNRLMREIQSALPASPAPAPTAAENVPPPPAATQQGGPVPPEGQAGAEANATT